MSGPKSTPVGLVLAGGAGRRMGRDKGSLPLRGLPLALIAATRLDPLCSSVCVSVASGAENPAPGYPAVEDASGASMGPLAGIAAVFEAVGERDLLVLACDYPLVTEELLRSIVAAGGSVGVTMAAGDRDHPLVALWHRSTREAVLGAVRAGALRVQDLVATLPVVRVTAEGSDDEDHERQLLNVNRPQDLALLEPGSGSGE